MSGNGAPTSVEALQRTPLHALHVELGARMMPFAGYEMPLHYLPGILKEHLHTRAAASLFDVSHMGQIALRPLSGDVADAGCLDPCRPRHQIRGEDVDGCRQFVQTRDMLGQIAQVDQALREQDVGDREEEQGV